jgi:hypothetical protein
MCIPPKKPKVKKQPKKSPVVEEEEAAVFILLFSLVFVSLNSELFTFNSLPVPTEVLPKCCRIIFRFVSQCR